MFEFSSSCLLAAQYVQCPPICRAAEALYVRRHRYHASSGPNRCTRPHQMKPMLPPRQMMRPKHNAFPDAQ